MSSLYGIRATAGNN